MLLTLKSITKSYKSQYGKISREVLKNLNLEVGKGEKIAIVGPSGSGKTTLLNLIGTLDTPDTGEIMFNDNMISTLSANELAAFRNREIGFVFQFHHLLPQLTLWENVLVPTLPVKNKSVNYAERAEYLMKRTGIWEQRFQKPGELSGGECQRTAVVRALINNPGIVLADEPTGALDEENAIRLSKLLMDFNEQDNITLIIVTHSMELAKRADKVYILKNGSLKVETKT